MDTFSSKLYSLALLYLITASFSVSAFSTLTYSCFTQDGKHYVDGCLYYSSGDEPIDVESVTVGCCIHTNTTDFWLTCATFGFYCSSGTFARVYPDVNATPPSRPTTTRAPSTPTTTKPQWYYRRTTTTRYQRNTRTTTHYRSYHRPTTAYSYRSRYRRTTTYRSTYSSSNVDTYRILKIAGGVGSAVLLIIAITSYCCKRKRANAEQTDNHISPQYSGADSIPMPTRSYNSNRQYSADGIQGVTSQDHQVPSYDEVTNNVNAYHTPMSPTYPSAPTGTNESLGPGTAYLLRSSERLTAAAGNEDLPNVAPPSYNDVTKPPEHKDSV